MYFIDSPTQEIRSYVFNQESGEIVFEKVAIRIPIEMGTPDGMTIDREGMLWIAHWGGYGVYRWNPNTGDLISKIDVPAPHVTSCAFAGEDLGTLIITTAQKNMTPDQLKDYPQSGNLFNVSTGIAGVKGHRCTF
jgi:sugar lactone lactonase YvrE